MDNGDERWFLIGARKSTERIERTLLPDGEGDRVLKKERGELGKQDCYDNLRTIVYRSIRIF